jgi:hypothetical protein
MAERHQYFATIAMEAETVDEVVAAMERSLPEGAILQSVVSQPETWQPEPPVTPQA